MINDCFASLNDLINNSIHLPSEICNLSLSASGGLWPHRLGVRTPAFQAENRGSIPRGATNFSRRTPRNSRVATLEGIG